METFTKLKCLYLNSNFIKKIEGLDELVQLNTLNLSNNRIHKIENLGGLVNLKTLDIGNNPLEKVSDIELVSECPSICSLDLGSTYITADDAFLDIFA